MNVQEFNVLVKAMRAVYPSPNFLNDEYAVKVWYRLLCDLPYEVANASIQKHALINKYPPTVADIRNLSAEIMMGDIKDWSESWGLTCKLISLYGIPNEAKAFERMDDLTAETVKRLGWQNLCLSQNVSADRANYRLIYERVVKDRKEKEVIPMELQNQIKLIGEPL